MSGKAPVPLEELLAHAAGTWQAEPEAKARDYDHGSWTDGAILVTELARRLRRVGEIHYWKAPTEPMMSGERRRCACGWIECPTACALAGEEE